MENAAERWDIVCNMDCYELLDDYHDQKVNEN